MLPCLQPAGVFKTRRRSRKIHSLFRKPLSDVPFRFDVDALVDRCKTSFVHLADASGCLPIFVGMLLHLFCLSAMKNDFFKTPGLGNYNLGLHLESWAVKEGNQQDYFSCYERSSAKKRSAKKLRSQNLTPFNRGILKSPSLHSLCFWDLKLRNLLFLSAIFCNNFRYDLTNFLSAICTHMGANMDALSQIVFTFMLRVSTCFSCSNQFETRQTSQ